MQLLEYLYLSMVKGLHAATREEEMIEVYLEDDKWTTKFCALNVNDKQFVLEL